jgi:hypothetical protein
MRTTRVTGGELEKAVGETVEAFLRSPDAVHLKFASAEWRGFGWSLFCHDFTKAPTDHLRQLRIWDQKSLGRVRAV